MKFEQHWPRGFRREVFEILNFFPYQCMVPIQMHREANESKKVKRQHTTIILAYLVDLSSPMICAKIQPQSFLDSGEEDF